MWLEAVDLVLSRLGEVATPFSQIKAISGAGQQHGSVYWTTQAEKTLRSLDPEQNLKQSLQGKFAHPYSPNWQDASTQVECDAFNCELGDEAQLATATGSNAHHVSVKSTT